MSTPSEHTTAQPLQAPGHAVNVGSVTGTANQDSATRLFRLSIGVFFIGGFLSSTISLFVPRMKLVYGLDYVQALLVQFAFHTSYLLFAFPIALTIMAIGYMRSTATGLIVIALSCGLLLLAHGLHNYATILLALLVMSAGITFLQIAANTVVAVVGKSDGAAFRLNLLQAFNSIGTVVAPLAAAQYVLGTPRATGLVAVREISPPFVFAILVLTGLAVLFALRRNLLDGIRQADVAGARFDWAALLRDRRLVAGTVAIFLYVGAEVAIGTLLVIYLVMPDTFGASLVQAGHLVSLYWAGAMVGRAIGAYVMRRIRPCDLLALMALSAVVLVGVAATVHGWAGGIALLAVGLCNSIMYPTIYVLALPEDPRLATPGGTVLCMAVVGGAIVPLLTGALADRFGLAASLALPALCYLFIAAFGRSCRGAKF